jgi:hypothetical protein
MVAHADLSGAEKASRVEALKVRLKAALQPLQTTEAAENAIADLTDGQELAVIIGALEALDGDTTFSEPVQTAIDRALAAAKLALASTDPTGGTAGQSGQAFSTGVAPGAPGGGGGSGYASRTN